MRYPLGGRSRSEKNGIHTQEGYTSLATKLFCSSTISALHLSWMCLRITLDNILDRFPFLYVRRSRFLDVHSHPFFLFTSPTTGTAFSQQKRAWAALPYDPFLSTPFDGRCCGCSWRLCCSAPFLSRTCCCGKITQEGFLNSVYSNVAIAKSNCQYWYNEDPFQRYLCPGDPGP